MLYRLLSSLIVIAYPRLEQDLRYIIDHYDGTQQLEELVQEVQCHRFKKRGAREQEEWTETALMVGLENSFEFCTYSFTVVLLTLHHSSYFLLLFVSPFQDWPV